LAPETIALGPDRTTSAKDLAVDAFELVAGAGCQEQASSNSKARSSFLQLGPPFPQRWKVTWKESQENEPRSAMRKPTLRELTKNLNVLLARKDTLKWAAVPPSEA